LLHQDAPDKLASRHMAKVVQVAQAPPDRYMTPPREELLIASEQTIDLWLTYYDEIADDRRADYRALLPVEERSQEFRFHFPDDRRRYLVTRAMVRTVLSRYFPVHPAAWRFATNVHGRPEIANFSRQECGLRFNISHTRGLIAVGITRNRELGIDVENVRGREVTLDIAERYFAAPEVAELARVPPAQRQDYFFEYWTFKESYIKARGMGLALPLEKFSFHYPHERAVQMAIDSELADDPDRWMFWQYRPTANHLLAVCAERRALPTSVTLRKTVPLIADEPIEAQLLKSSHRDS
jgi:4'-phosphopantetheinyl transferase